MSGCVYGATLQQQIGATFATQSPSALYYNAAQGWSIAWNVQLNSRTGEMDFINVHGGGNGGFVWCDGAINFTPGTCQMSLDASGNLSILGRLVPSTLYSAAGTALPTCTGALKGQQAVVTDATTPTYLGTHASGGAVVAPVVCSGSNWVSY